MGREPALPARRLRARVPGDAERLQAAIGKLDQTLLQRIDAEGVLDFIVAQFAVGPISIGVLAKNLPSCVKKVEVMPANEKRALLKSPATLLAVAGCMARS